MRLRVLENGQRRPARLFIKTVQGLSRKPIDPVVKLALYRPEFFGRPFLALVAETLRGPSYWTASEREYFAAFTSEQNECPFCVRVHSEAARIEGGVNAAAISLRPEASAVLPLLEKLTREGDVSAADIDAVRGAGVPDDAIADALHVNLVFNTINRLANAFALEWQSDSHARLAAQVIHRIRYRLPSFAMR